MYALNVARKRVEEVISNVPFFDEKKHLLSEMKCLKAIVKVKGGE